MKKLPATERGKWGLQGISRDQSWHWLNLHCKRQRKTTSLDLGKGGCIFILEWHLRSWNLSESKN